MAFWGMSVDTLDHASLAVKTAFEMAHTIRKFNEEHRSKGLLEIGVEISLNTGTIS